MIRRLVVACALGLALVAPAGAGAAQSIGLTWDPTSIKLYRYAVDGGHTPAGMQVEATGLDGEVYGVRVAFPRNWNVPGWGSNRPLSVHFDNDPNTTTYPCAAIKPGDLPHPPDGFAALHSQYCLVTLADGQQVMCLVQAFPKRVKDFGGEMSDAPYDIYVSAHHKNEPLPYEVWVNPTASGLIKTSIPEFYDVAGLPEQQFPWGSPILQAYPRWSKYYRGTLKHSVTKHFPVLFGSFTLNGVGIYGPGDRKGAPTNSFGRNVYIDTLDSDYGPGWRRIMGVLTQPDGGTYCYEFSKKGASGGKTGISKSNTYRLTAIGPALTPVVRVEFHGPTFPFGNAAYNPLVDKWGTNLSDEQTTALKLQATLMGSNWARPVKGTDCAKTLRQLPAGFIP